MTKPKTFTLQQIRESIPPKFDAETISAAPRYIIIKNKVYDVSGEFLSWHPGGSVALAQIGADATGAFEGFHSPKSFLHLERFCVGELDPRDIAPQSEWNKDIQTLRMEAKKLGLYESSKIYYLNKVSQVLGLLLVGVSCIAYSSSIAAVCVSAFFVALGFQQAGWLAHDFCHHQVFMDRNLNTGLGYFLGNVVQGFSIAWWKQKHCTHHAAPNIHLQDPDIDTLPFLAWSEHALELFQNVCKDELASFMVNKQHYFFFPLLAFARFSWALESIKWNLKSRHTREFPTNYSLELLGLFIHYSWYFGSGFYFLEPLKALLWIALSQLICGIMLASVFSLNHNGMPVLKIDEFSKKDFYEIAIVTGRNVEPTPFNNWFTGGLNFQVD